MSSAGASLSPEISAPIPPSKRAVSILKDFPDRFSPMVVKELRQGLRSPIFLWAFMAMHFVLAFTVLASFGSDSKQGPTQLFWWTLVVPMCFILPLRGFNALSDERRLNTFDTLVLTRLNALRITFGKWAAIAAQILLLASTILPYLVMRYFSGGINVATEIKWLGHFTMLGLVFAAGTVGFSWVKYFFLRGLLTLALGWALFMAVGTAIFRILSASSMSYVWGRLAEIGWPLMLGAYGVSVFAIYFLLDYAAAQIAPISENRSTVRRIIGLLTVLGLSLAGVFLELKTNYYVRQLFVNTAIGIAALCGVDAASERTAHFQTICQPFVKRGFLGRLAGRIFYPGWHSGLLFLFLVCGIAGAGLAYNQYREIAAGSYPAKYQTEFWKQLISNYTLYFGQTLFVLLLIRLFARNTGAPLIAFLCGQVLFVLLQELLRMFAESTHSAAVDLIAFPSFIAHKAYQQDFMRVHAWENNSLAKRHLPPNPDPQPMLGDRWLNISLALLAVYLIALLVLAWREFRITKRLETLAIQDLKLHASDV